MSSNTLSSISTRSVLSPSDSPSTASVHSYLSQFELAEPTYTPSPYCALLRPVSWTNELRSTPSLEHVRKCTPSSPMSNTSTPSMTVPTEPSSTIPLVAWATVSPSIRQWSPVIVQPVVARCVLGADDRLARSRGA